MLRIVAGARWGCCGHGGMAGRAAPAWLGLRVCVVLSRCAVSCRAVRLYVVINRVLPGAAGSAARVPTARNRARCTGRRDCPWFPSSCMALRERGLVPPPGGKLTGSAAATGAAISCGRRDGGGGGPGLDLPGGDAGVPHRAGGDHGPQPAQHGGRARGAGLPAGEPVVVPARRRACLAISTLLWRSAPQTARQAADRRPGRPRREIRVCPLMVAEVRSEGFSPACLTTARPEANRAELVKSSVCAVRRWWFEWR